MENLRTRTAYWEGGIPGQYDFADNPNHDRDEAPFSYCEWTNAARAAEERNQRTPEQVAAATRWEQERIARFLSNC